MAYAIWHLKSEFKEDGNVKIKVWNESGVFRKEKGQWKIALIHSTPAKQN
jgi:ketosteroid isomerase-like protein